MIRTSAPSVTDDVSKGFNVGDLWNMPSSGKVYVARSVAAGAAVWEMSAPVGVQLLGGNIDKATDQPLTATLGALNAALSIDVSDWASAVLWVSTNASMSGTITFEASMDGSNWQNYTGYSVNGLNVISTTTSFTAGNIWRFTTIGIKFLRARVSSYSSGSCVFGVVRSTDANGDSSGFLNTGAISPQTSSGGFTTTARLISAAASTNATLIKNSSTHLGKVFGWNAAASLRYLKLYNKASAPTVGTDTPFMTIPLKPTEFFDIDFIPVGFRFTTGLAYALTVNATDSDTTALTAGDVLGLNFLYV